MTNQYDYFRQMDVATLTEFFSSEQEESEQLEFKSGKCLISDLYAEVSAFANTDGGIIILGAPREVYNDATLDGKRNKKERRKVCIGSLDPSKEDRTTDSILQMFLKGITPSIMGIKVHRLVHPDGFIYIIYVPQSINSPHQVNGAYHMRIGTMCERAPHGFVQALFNKKKPTKLVAHVAVKARVLSDHYNDLKFQIHIGNESRFPIHNTEGFIALIGDLKEVNTKKFDISVTPNKKWYLQANLKSPSALVNNFWWSPRYENIYFHGDYFYMQLYLWAHETEAITRLYKIGLDGIIEETDMADNTPSRQEVDIWNGHIEPEKVL